MSLWVCGPGSASVKSALLGISLGAPCHRLETHTHLVGLGLPLDPILCPEKAWMWVGGLGWPRVHLQRNTFGISLAFPWIHISVPLLSLK